MKLFIWRRDNILFSMFYYSLRSSKLYILGTIMQTFMKIWMSWILRTLDSAMKDNVNEGLFLRKMAEAWIKIKQIYMLRGGMST